MSTFARSLWAATASPAPDCLPLSGPADADVAVVGAGYTGLSAALHLAQAGKRVLVPESQEPGFGCSGRNGGQVNPMLPFNSPEKLRELIKQHLGVGAETIDGMLALQNDSDRELLKSVNKKLLQRAGGSGCKITATVASGMVTLAGILGQEYQRRLLISSMQGINGVKRVVDSMTVAPRKKRE